MISFHHLKNCKQIIDNLNLDWGLKKRFIVDTREYQNGEVFIAIPGQRVNPLNLIKDLLTRGCQYICYQKCEENDSIVKNYQGEFPAVNFIAVKDSIAFIQELAHLHIKEWLEDKSHTLFAISGSNGKTTHKEMLSHIMEEILPGRVVSTQKNNNNHLGVPLTLLNVSEETQFVVLELGSNHPGEIKFLCDIALPNAGITTNIGATHLEFFGTEREVFLEEGYLYYAVKENTDGKGFFLINQNDKFLKELADTAGSRRFSSNDDGQVKMTFFPNGAKLGDVEVHNELITGQHNKSNLVTCAYIAVNFFPQFREHIIKAASSFSPTPNRSQWIEVGGAKVFLDAYNANPSSMKAALQGFKEQLLQDGQSLDQSCVVLGDMNELGDRANVYHQEIGSFVREQGFKNIFFIGRFAQEYIKGAKEGRAYENATQFKPEYQKRYLRELGYHFIKGSRSLQLESLFDIT